MLAHDARLRSNTATSRRSTASPYLFRVRGLVLLIVRCASRKLAHRTTPTQFRAVEMPRSVVCATRSEISCIAPCAAPRSFPTTLDKLGCALSCCSKKICSLTFLRCSAISPPVRPDVAGEQGDMSRTQGCVGKPACRQGQRGGGGSGSTRRVSHCPPARTPNRPRAGRATEFHPSMPMALSSHSRNGARARTNLTGGTLSWRMTNVCSACRR